jgi:hypothetical protein
MNPVVAEEEKKDKDGKSVGNGTEKAAPTDSDAPSNRFVTALISGLVLLGILVQCYFCSCVLSWMLMLTG